MTGVAGFVTLVAACCVWLAVEARRQNRRYERQCLSVFDSSHWGGR